LIPKKKSRKKPVTPRSQIKNCLRMLSLRSRERAFTIKRDGYACVKCGKKQSKAVGRECTLEVHHLNGAGIDQITELIYQTLLCSPDHQVTLCRDCHREIDGR